MTTETKASTSALAVRDRFKELTEQLDQFPSDKFNRLVPAAAQEFSPLFRPVFTVVRVEVDPAAKDIYAAPGQTTQFALHATALQRIANALGISWEQIVVTHPEENVWTASGAGYVLHPNGERIRIPATYTLDARDGSPVAARAGGQLQSIRQFGAQRAETGCMSRVIRKAAGMKSTYTKDELAKPFVALLWRPDESDPEVRGALLDRIRYQDAKIYGLPAPTAPPSDGDGGDAPRALAAPTKQLDAGHGSAEQDVREAERAATFQDEPPVEDPAEAVQPTLDAVSELARIRTGVEKIREGLRWQNKPWSDQMRQARPTEKQMVAVATATAKAITPTRLNADQMKVLRRALLTALWGDFGSWQELNADQLSASIEWIGSAPTEVRQACVLIARADPALDDIAKELGA